MLNIFQHLSKRESIIYFFIHYYNNKLNGNCEKGGYFSKLECSFIIDYINEYFHENHDMCKLSICQKYYHIFYKNEEYDKNKKFINFKVGYIGKTPPSLIDKHKLVTYENVLELKIDSVYPIDIVQNKIRDGVKLSNLFYRCYDKKLLYSIYQYTIEFKKISLSYRIKLICGDIKREDVFCLCGDEVCMDKLGKRMKATCGNSECESKLRSFRAKTCNNMSGVHNRKVWDANGNKTRGRILTDEHKAKIGKSNAAKWTDEFRIKDKQNRINKGVYEKQSIVMKRMILNGEWTPKSENRLRGKRIISDKTGIQYRSKWELVYHEDNPNLKYETIRINYMDGENKRVYIVDFEDVENRLLIEIKPKSESNTGRVLAKANAANKWCEDNGYKYVIVTEKDYNFYDRIKNRNNQC